MLNGGPHIGKPFLCDLGSLSYTPNPPFHLLVSAMVWPANLVGMWLWVIASVLGKGERKEILPSHLCKITKKGFFKRMR